MEHRWHGRVRVHRGNHADQRDGVHFDHLGVDEGLGQRRQGVRRIQGAGDQGKVRGKVADIRNW
ncbi:MAG: hypothetical protein ACK55I_13840, partial [bacterium]